LGWGSWFYFLKEVTGGVTQFVARLPEVASSIDEWKG
jgi:hypothetical protein